MDKVKITREQADAIGLMKAKGAPINEIVERHVNKDHILVNGFGHVQAMATDKLIRALYIGYEVNDTAEDKVRGLYDYFGQAVPYSGIDVQNKIQIILTTLNIKIEGITVI